MATQKQCAAHLFMSTERFNVLLNDGVIERMPAGKYELDTIREQYIKHVRDIASGRSGNMKANLDLTEERARLAKEQADSQEMKNSVQRGSLVQIDDVVDIVEEQFIDLRAKLLGMPTKIAPLVFASSDLREAKSIFEEGVLEALDELVGYNQREAERLAESLADESDSKQDKAPAKADG